MSVAGIATAVGIDVGGTHLRGALVGPTGIVGEVVRRRSAVDEPQSLVASLVALLDEFGQGESGRGSGGPLPVGIGLAGLVDRGGRLLYGPNVAVRDLDLAALLRPRLGAERTIRVLNDATAATLAEHRLGVGRGHDDLVMVTLGTGVGGGAVVAGRLLEGAHGMAGEFGHLVIAKGGRSAPSGIDGTVEAYVSGTAIARAAATHATDAPAVVAAAGDGAAWAVTLLEEVGRDLGIALASIAAVLDPSLIIVGGGAGHAAAPWLLPAARASLREHLLGADLRPEVRIVPAELGDDAGLIGAALAATDARIQHAAGGTAR